MNPDIIEHKSITAALHAVYQETGYVQKTGNVNFGNTKYKYAGEADLIAAIRPSMVKHGVVVNVVDTEIVYSAPGHVIVKCMYEFNHISGTALKVSSMGEGKDSGDKAIPKALTGAYKYALRQTFMIETGDDPDQFASDKVNEDIKKAEAKRECQEFERQLGGATSEKDITTLWKQYGSGINHYKTGGKIEKEYYQKLVDMAATKKAEVNSKPKKQVWEDEDVSSVDYNDIHHGKD